MNKNIRFFGVLMAFCLGFLFLNIPFSTGQDIPISEAETASENSDAAEAEAPMVIKMSVEEVRLDVVVVDNRGRPVTNLKATDFEVFQNGARQNILSSVYIENQSDAAAQPSASASRKADSILPTLPVSQLKREDTRRTIIFVLDEMSMGMENMYNAKTSLRNFVEKQMLSGDMVAILSTGRGNSALQMFLSDKNQLLARINALRLTSPPPEPSPDDSHLYRIYDNQLFTLSYGIRALRDMPGRKILNMLTVETSFSVPLVRVLSESLIERINFYEGYNNRFSRLAEDALRAGVVINFLDIVGLQNQSKIQDVSVGSWTERDIDPAYNNADFNYDPSKPASMTNRPPRWYVDLPPTVKVLLEENTKEVRENARNARNLINPLPAKTGGVIIENTNFFLDGIDRDVDNMMKGYYLISYEPPSDTFGSDGKEVFNQIKVNVKRRNVVVHTRDGFYNREEREKAVVHPLQEAIFSPFQHADLDVNMSAGYVRDVKAGYLIRTWIHIDPKDVKIVEKEDGGARIEIETICLTSDINGTVHDIKHVAHDFNIEPEKRSENIAWIRKHGIRFAMLLPVKNPGSYYVRTAVQDVESGKVGSAYQFVEIPDVGMKGLELSDIFMLTGSEDMNWLLSDATKGIDEGLFFTEFQAEEVRSPALRTYTSGDVLQTLSMLYNADEKALAGLEIEMQSILYKDGKEYGRSEPAAVKPGKVENLEGIPISFTIGSGMPVGDYALQLTVTDKKNSKKKEGNATQTIGFTIAEK